MGDQSDSLGDLEIYKALSDELRLRILKLLSRREMCVNDIISQMGESQSLISHKLRNLREIGLVVSYRSGKKIIYGLSGKSIARFLEIGERTGQEILRACNCVECDPNPMIREMK